MGPLIPQSVCDRVRLLASVHGETALREITGLSSGTLYRIKRRGFRAIPKGFRQRPRPSDFAIQERHMSSLELAKHYRTSNTTVARWRRELREQG